MSDEFKQFVSRSGIRHRTSAPYHPATNGLAERAVQVVKSGLRKNSTGDINLRLARILFRYRNTPHATTGVTPAELLLGRKPRTHLDFLHPDLAIQVQKKQERQRVNHDNRKPERSFDVNDPVLVRNFQTGDKWLTGKVTRVFGPRSLQVQLSDGKVVRRHLDHVRSRKEFIDDRDQPAVILLPPIDNAPDMPSADTDSAPTETETPPTDTASVQSDDIRRSSRPRNPPDRYSPGCT